MNNKILVVDDSPTELTLISDALRAQGYFVSTVMSGEDALVRAGHDNPDLIVLDVVLPGMNGFQVCRKLKKDEKTTDIKVLMVTSKDQESDRFWGMRQGADAYLTKPFAKNDLLENVARLL